jgi:SAM-dependent methyltransferase
MLRQMREARRFNRWMADTISPFIKGDVLEIGSGIGNLTEFLSPGRGRYVASDTDEDHLAELERRFPSLELRACNAAKPQDFAGLRDEFDTVVCLNVLEHIPDDRAVLKNLLSALRPNGSAIILVPQGAIAFGTLDEVLEHQRRYSREEVKEKLQAAGFRLQSMLSFNRATFPGWLVNSRILRRRTLSSFQLRTFDALVPVWRSIDRYLPWPSTSLIAIASKPRLADDA